MITSKFLLSLVLIVLGLTAYSQFEFEAPVKPIQKKSNRHGYRRACPVELFGSGTRRVNRAERMNVRFNFFGEDHEQYTAFSNVGRSY